MQEQESRLDVLRQRAGALTVAPERHKSIETCFEWTYQLLPDPAQVFFPTLGTFIGGFTSEAAAFVSQTKNVEHLLNILDEASLVQFDERTQRYTLLPIVRDYALNKAKDYVEVCRGFHAEYFKNLAVKHGDKERWDIQNEDLDVIEVERDNVLEGMKLAYEFGDSNAVVAYMRGLRHFFEIRGYWNLARERLHWGIDSAQQINDKSSLALFKSHLGVLFDKHDIVRAEALYKEALAIYEQLGDLNGQAMGWYDLGGIEGRRGKLQDGMKLLERSLSLGEKSNHKWGQAHTLQQMGFFAQGIALRKKGHTEEGEYVEKAKELSLRALEMYEEIGDEAGIAATSRNLGDVFMMKNQHPIAYEYYERSLLISEKRGHKKGIAASLHCFGKFFRDEDDEKAYDYFIKSLKIKQELGSPQDEAVTLDQLAYLERDLGRQERQVGDHQEAVRHFRAALQYWEQCRDIYEDLRSPAVERIRGEIGRIKKDLKRLNYN